MNAPAVSEQQVFEAVGTAVFSSQVFEVAFVLAARFALKQPHVRTIEEVVPLAAGRAFKQPVLAIIKELTQDGRVDVALVNRVVALLEKRHRIIHREYLESKWPLEDPAWRQEFFGHCVEVAKESQLLVATFGNLVLDWMDRSPELEGAAKQLRDQLS